MIRVLRRRTSLALDTPLDGFVRMEKFDGLAPKDFEISVYSCDGGEVVRAVTEHTCALIIPDHAAWGAVDTAGCPSDPPAYQASPLPFEFVRSRHHVLLVDGDAGRSDWVKKLYAERTSRNVSIDGESARKYVQSRLDEGCEEWTAQFQAKPKLRKDWLDRSSRKQPPSSPGQPIRAPSMPHSVHAAPAVGVHED